MKLKNVDCHVYFLIDKTFIAFQIIILYIYFVELSYLNFYAVNKFFKLLQIVEDT